MEENKIKSTINKIIHNDIDNNDVLCTINEKNVTEYFREIVLLTDNELNKLLTKESGKLLCKAISEKINEDNNVELLTTISKLRDDKIISILINENLKEIFNNITNNINENNIEYYLNILLAISKKTKFDEIFSTTHKHLLDKIINNITKHNTDKILNIFHKEAIKDNNDKQFKNITYDNIGNFLSRSTGIQIFNKLINFISLDNVDKFCCFVSCLDGIKLKTFLESENNKKSTLLNTISKHINTNNFKKCFLMLSNFKKTDFGTFATNKNGEELLLAISNNITRETVSNFTYIILNTINIESFDAFINSNSGIEIFRSTSKNIDVENVANYLNRITSYQDKKLLEKFINNKNTQIIFQTIVNHINTNNTDKFIIEVLDSSLLDIIVSSDAGKEIFDNILNNITEDNIINCFNELIKIKQCNFNTESFERVCGKIGEKLNTDNAVKILQEVIKLNDEQLGNILNNKDIQQILQIVCNNITNENIVNYFNILSSLDKDKLNILSSNKTTKQIINKTIENIVNNNNDKYLIQLSFKHKDVFDTFFTKNDTKIVFNDDSLNTYINIAKLCELMSFSIDKYRNEISNELNINKNDLLDFVEFGLEKIKKNINKNNKLRKVEINALMEILQEYLFSKLEIIKNDDNLEQVNKLIGLVNSLQSTLNKYNNIPKLQKAKPSNKSQKRIKKQDENIIKKENKKDIKFNENFRCNVFATQKIDTLKQKDAKENKELENITNSDNNEILSTNLQHSDISNKTITNNTIKETLDNKIITEHNSLQENNTSYNSNNLYIVLYILYNYLQQLRARQVLLEQVKQNILNVFDNLNSSFITNNFRNMYY